MAQPLENMTVAEVLDAVGAKSPTPGGGAVASLTAALAAALARMVVEFSAGRKSLAAHGDLHEMALAALRGHVGRAVELAEEDARAYAALNSLWKLAEDDPRRRAEWDGAVAAAIDAPRGVLAEAIEILDLLGRLVGSTNRMLRSDLAIAAVLAEAAARSAAWNVAINLPQVSDPDEAKRLAVRTDATVEEARRRARDIEAGCR